MVFLGNVCVGTLHKGDNDDDGDGDDEYDKIIITSFLDSCDRDTNILSDRNNSRSVPHDTLPQVSHSHHWD